MYFSLTTRSFSTVHLLRRWATLARRLELDFDLHSSQCVSIAWAKPSSSFISHIASIITVLPYYRITVTTINTTATTTIIPIIDTIIVIIITWFPATSGAESHRSRGGAAAPAGRGKLRSPLSASRPPALTTRRGKAFTNIK